MHLSPTSLFILITLTASLMGLTSAEAAPNATSSYTNSARFFCPKGQADMLPRTSNCFKAALLLPHSPTEGHFHHLGTRDAYQLPVTSSFTDCTVTVDIDPGSSLDDQTSWSAIAGVLTQLLFACADSDASGTRSGGIVRTGDLNRIKISVKKSWGSGHVGVTQE